MKSGQNLVGESRLHDPTRSVTKYNPSDRDDSAFDSRNTNPEISTKTEFDSYPKTEHEIGPKPGRRKVG